MRKRVLYLTLCALVVGTAVTAAPAGAAEVAPAAFAQQARAAGLDASQSTWLQHEVDHYRTLLGGKQTGPNRIDLDGTGEVLVALPGEAHPRAFGQASPDATYPECTGGTQRGYFCAYSGTWGRGSQIRMYACNRQYNIPWVGYGSWGNNQTGDVLTIFFNNSGFIYDVSAPPSNNQEYDWGPVHFVVPC